MTSYKGSINTHDIIVIIRLAPFCSRILHSCFVWKFWLYTCVVVGHITWDILYVTLFFTEDWYGDWDRPTWDATYFLKKGIQIYSHYPYEGVGVDLRQRVVVYWRTHKSEIQWFK